MDKNKIASRSIIKFPKHEHPWYESQILLGNPIWTSRFDKEFGRYKVGNVYESEFGVPLIVIEVNREKFSENHPNYKNLTKAQKEGLTKAVYYDHVKLEPLIKKN